MKFFEKLDYYFDIEKLQNEVENLVSTIGFQGEDQMSLVYRDGHKQDCWTDGAGTSFQFDENRNPLRDNNGEILRRFTEDQFKYINPGLEGTEIEKVYLTLKQKYKLSRYRIAKIEPKKCYGWHKDEEIRIHVPVITAPGCFVITEDGNATHLPATGEAYIFYARNGYHTAINADYKINRLHLLLNIC